MTDDDSWLEGGPVLLDKHELARALKYPVKAVDSWVRAGCPTHGSKRTLRFVLWEVVHWLMDQKGDELNAAKIKQAAALARKRELEVGQMEGRLVDISEVTKENRDRLAKLQSDLMAIPSRFPAEVQKEVRAAIVESINRMAE